MRLRDRLWLLASQAVNALAFGGHPDESLSARAWREQWPKGINRIDAWLGAGHCAAVYLQHLSRIERRHMSRKA